MNVARSCTSSKILAGGVSGAAVDIAGRTRSPRAGGGGRDVGAFLWLIRSARELCASTSGSISPPTSDLPRAHHHVFQALRQVGSLFFRAASDHRLVGAPDRPAPSAPGTRPPTPAGGSNPDQLAAGDRRRGRTRRRQGRRCSPRQCASPCPAACPWRPLELRGALQARRFRPFRRWKPYGGGISVNHDRVAIIGNGRTCVTYVRIFLASRCR